MSGFRLHVFSDGKRLLAPTTAVDFTAAMADRIREALETVDGHQLVVFGEPIEIVEHAYTLGQWREIAVDDKP